MLCQFCSGQRHLRKCLDLCTDPENGIVRINNLNRFVPGPAGGEIPLALAVCGDCTIGNYVHGGASNTVNTTDTAVSPLIPTTTTSSTPTIPIPASLTSPVSCSTDTYLHTAANTGTIATAAAGSHPPFRTISESQSQHATPFEIHRSPTARHKN